MGSYCFGIDVGGTTVKCGLFQTDGNLVDKWEIPTRTENKGENILPDVAKAIQDKMAEKGIEKADVEGVGIGIPGPINSKGEAACAVNLYWGFTPVAQILHDLTGLKACAGNDANVAALGEAWKGAAAGSDNVIMVTLGTGVGGGIIVDGKIVAGTHGAGGEIGHVLVYVAKQKNVTAAIMDVWNSMHLLPESYVWQEECLLHLKKTVLFADSRTSQQKMSLMHSRKVMHLQCVPWNM